MVNKTQRYNIRRARRECENTLIRLNLYIWKNQFIYALFGMFENYAQSLKTGVSPLSSNLSRIKLHQATNKFNGVEKQMTNVVM